MFITRTAIVLRQATRMLSHINLQAFLFGLLKCNLSFSLGKSEFGIYILSTTTLKNKIKTSNQIALQNNQPNLLQGCHYVPDSVIGSGSFSKTLCLWFN